MSLPLLAAGPPSPRPPGQSQSPPTLSSAVIGTNGTSLTLTFSEAVTGFASGAEGFALTGLSGGATTLTYASGNGTSSVVMTISRTVAQGETGGSLAYTAGDITASSNGLSLANFSGTAVTNSSTQTPITLSSATIQASGTTLRLVFSGAASGFASGAEGFALTGLTGGATALTYSSGNGTATVDFTISRTVYSYETSGALAYTAGDIAGANTLALANFSGTSVTNSSTQVTAPTIGDDSSGSLAASTAITLPTSSSGDYLVVMVAGAASLPDPTLGWERHWNTATGGGAPYLALYSCVSDGTPTTPLSANVSGGWIAWTVQNSGGIDATSSAADSGLSSSIVAPSHNATTAADLMLNGYMAYKAASSPVVTLPASQTGTDVGPVTLTSGQLRGGSETLSASGATGTRTATVSTTVRWVGGTVLMLPA